MLKGVNRQILEVTNTENPYFERVIFFVKPEYRNEERSKLKREAEALCTAVQKPPKQKRTKKELVSIITKGVLFTLAGMALSYLLYAIL